MKPMEVCKKCQHDMDKCTCPKISNCKDCYVTIDKIWQCGVVYDGDTCPVYKKAAPVAGFERCDFCGAFNAPGTKCKLCNNINAQHKEENKMKHYLGVKAIKAKPMTRQEYCDYQGWELPKNETPLANEVGMLVEYEDTEHPNHKDHKGYISWSPLGVFKEAYRETTGLTFGLAIEALKKGHKLCRAGWNGKGMWIVYMTPMQLPAYNTQGTVRKVNDRTANLIGEDTPLHTDGYFAMWTAGKTWQPGWLASQADMLAEDWEIV